MIDVIVQVCPNCLSTVELPDTAAGTTAACPKCSETFAVPARHEPQVAGLPTPTPVPVTPPAPVTPPTPVAETRPAPPPGFVPPIDRPAAPHTSPAAEPLATDGTTFTLKPSVLDWVPVICFTLIFLLTFFNWVGLYPGGIKAYAQSPWFALIGWIDTDPTAEGAMKIEGSLKPLLSMNILQMLPYFLLLFWAVVLGWADRIVKQDQLKDMPGPLEVVGRIWPYRTRILAVLAVATLALLTLQLARGFGLENAAEQLVANDFAERLTAAQNDSEALRKLQVQQGMQLGQYNIGGTVWLTFAFLLHITAVVAAGLRAWVTRRGTKPLPRVTFWS